MRSQALRTQTGQVNYRWTMKIASKAKKGAQQ